MNNEKNSNKKPLMNEENKLKRSNSISQKALKESIFDVKDPKPTHFKLSNDSTSMGFAAFLKINED